VNRPHPISLPIDSLIGKIRSSLKSYRNLVLQASPGSGKTTRVPVNIAEDLPPQSQVWVLEPRRLAAKWSALRVAEERGEVIGKSIGYHFRFEKVESGQTRVLFLTEGMMIRRLLDNRSLKGVGAVVLDEFHERGLHADSALAYVRHLQNTIRPDLKIIVMSATIDTEPLKRYLDDCPVFQLDAPVYPVQYEYLSKITNDPPEKKVVQAVSEILSDPATQDTLVFLPGIGDIRRAEIALQRFRSSHSVVIAPLHGELDRKEQDLAIGRSTSRKIILATNIAETSLTIEGVNVVVDSGLFRAANYSWWSGVPSLKTKPISRASAIQRAGRAGRMGPGKCFRLYSKADFDARPAFETPEIRRADLSQLLLELHELGIRGFETFPWFEPPAEKAREASEKLLFRLGAIESKTGDLSEIGKQMVRIPAHPRLARMLIEAEIRHVVQECATLAALISEGELDRMDALEQASRAALTAPLKKLKEQFLSNVKDSKIKNAARDGVAKSVLTGFGDRVARRRSHARGRQGETELVLASGGSARVPESDLILNHEYFVVLDIQEEQHLSQLRSQLRVRAVCPIEADWLFELEPCPVLEKETLSWNRDRCKVQAVSSLACDEMALTESVTEPSPSRETLRVLLREGLSADLEKVEDAGSSEFYQLLSTGLNKERWEEWLARLQFIRKFQPGLALPEWSEIRSQFLASFTSCLSLDEFKERDWIGESASLGKLDLERALPSHLTLPSGRRTEIHYSLDSDPYIASRLQDFFGWKQAPQLLGGKVPLTIHLLAPNKRAVQVTRDLAGFWEREYPRLRKELGRKYPRHAWPENPLIPLPKK
jgi:ATP-dependent helicase HrpB